MNLFHNLLVTPTVRFMFWRVEKRQRPLIASINVVNRCNLHCAGCYWTKSEREQERNELSLQQGVELIGNLWEQGIRHFFFIGGEPMTEREKVEAWVREVGRRHGISIIVTNGTYGLPASGEWPRTRFFISCDGDKVGMDRVRGFDRVHRRHVFEQVKQVAFGRKDVKLAMTISKLNVDRIEAFVRETVTWGIGGIAFSFATPNVGENQSFYLSAERREQAVQELLRLKREFPAFIAMGTRTIELLRPAEVARWSASCPAYIARSLRSDGQPIERCIFGPQADCSRCGSNIYTAFLAVREGDPETPRFFL
jgi:MoaA/NifB/PqqE/SkfB family radical SAM enzyme